MDHPEIPESEKSVWERASTIKWIWRVLIIGCIVFAAAGFAISALHLGHSKPHFEDKTGIAGIFGQIADHFPAFYALVGFVSFSFIVLVGQHLRLILMREEGYYDPVPEKVADTDKVRATDMDVEEDQ